MSYPTDHFWYIDIGTCDALRDIVPPVQLENVKSAHERELLLVKLQF